MGARREPGALTGPSSQPQQVSSAGGSSAGALIPALRCPHGARGARLPGPQSRLRAPSAVRPTAVTRRPEAWSPPARGYARRSRRPRSAPRPPSPAPLSPRRGHRLRSRRSREGCSQVNRTRARRRSCGDGGWEHAPRPLDTPARAAGESRGGHGPALASLSNNNLKTPRKVARNPVRAGSGGQGAGAAGATERWATGRAGADRAWRQVPGGSLAPFKIPED